ncbi:MAG: hypothetical protein ACFFBH_00515 [Promethearchaeota archaeon]
MNDLIFFSLIMLIFLRAVGLGVSVEFFYNTRDRKFISFIFCWIFWMIANIFPILADIVLNMSLKEIFLIVNILFFILGVIFYFWGFWQYYLIISSRILIALIIISIITPLLLYILIDFNIAMTFSTMIIMLLFLSGYIIPPLKKREFVKYMGKTIRWYYAATVTFVLYFPISIISYTLGYRYGVYFAEEPLIIILYYIPSLGITLLLIVLLVHIEYSISSRHKNDLKDKYSHDLGNIMQAISSAYELYSLKLENIKGSAELDNMLKSKITEAGKLIKDIREL